jgi:hypothetical protein
MLVADVTGGVVGACMLQVRYEVIEEYLPKIGGSEVGFETMYQTCTAQVLIPGKKILQFRYCTHIFVHC